MTNPAPVVWGDAAEPAVSPEAPPAEPVASPEPVALPEPIEPKAETPQPVRGAPRPERAVSPHGIDYIPLWLYLLFSVGSAGLYPYLWLMKRVGGFSAAGVTGLDRPRIGRYCVLGICAQLLPLASGVICLWGWLAGVPEWYASAFLMLTLYSAAFVLVILPMRCFYHFDIRWRLRRAASQWDENGLMIARTLPSPFLLCLFGTAYLQRHVNRLIGLGMPGFTGYDDVGAGATIGDAIREYVQDRTRRE